MFDDPFLLHCSQTPIVAFNTSIWFDDPFLLHCSQTLRWSCSCRTSLMILFFYTALKLLQCFQCYCGCLMILFFYTALKLVPVVAVDVPSLMILFFYTALKHFNRIEELFREFDDPFLLHCSQTPLRCSRRPAVFDDPFLLHCSQTGLTLIALRLSLMILFFYTALKPECLL